jgi:ABC-type branched-subunit amino acid transport system permease subunit
MRAAVAILTVVAFASVPLWLRDPYLMNALITTGIFIIGAMSLNLLLGFTGQLSLGHIAFFGIGAYVSALTSLGFDVGLPFGIRIRSRSLAADRGLRAWPSSLRDYADISSGCCRFACAAPIS